LYVNGYDSKVGNGTALPGFDSLPFRRKFLLKGGHYSCILLK
jgi:hypothetical protein